MGILRIFPAASQRCSGSAGSHHGGSPHTSAITAPFSVPFPTMPRTGAAPSPRALRDTPRSLPERREAPGPGRPLRSGSALTASARRGARGAPAEPQRAPRGPHSPRRGRSVPLDVHLGLLRRRHDSGPGAIAGRGGPGGAEMGGSSAPRSGGGDGAGVGGAQGGWGGRGAETQGRAVRGHGREVGRSRPD